MSAQATAREPWEQISGEPDEAYRRFLIYRNCGLWRSMRKAYHRYLQSQDGFTGGRERIHVPGSWIDDCRDWFWVNRASAWDIHNLSTYGARVAALHTQAIVQIAHKNARYGKKLKPGDEGYTDLLNSVRLVAEYMNPDVMRGIQAKQRRKVLSAGRGDGRDRAAVE